MTTEVEWLDPTADKPLINHLFGMRRVAQGRSTVARMLRRSWIGCLSSSYISHLASHLHLPWSVVGPAEGNHWVQH